MPRPPILPTLNWNEIWHAGAEWAAWIAAAEYPEHAAKMSAAFRDLVVEPDVAAHARALPRRVHVVAIAEDWCGDVVRHAPMLEALALASGGRIAVRYIPRAPRTDVFVRFLTNGGEAIPKFIFLSENFVECGNWGPMPDNCRRLIARGKAAGDVGAARRLVSDHYASDPQGHIVVRELLALAEIAGAGAV